MSLILREHDHKYLDEHRPYLDFVPCSTIIGEYFDNFDAIAKARELAQRNSGKYKGMSEAQILMQWKANSKRATTYGTLIHSIVEEYIKTIQMGQMYLTEDALKLSVTSSFRKALPGMYKEDYRNTISERIMDVRVMETKHAIAGTGDLQWNIGKKRLYDIKTGGRPIQGLNPYNEYCKEPLAHIPAIKWYQYQAQLGVYAFMIYKEFGEWPEETGILWWDDKKLEFELILIPIDQKALTTMIRHYFKIKEYAEHKGL